MEKRLYYKITPVNYANELIDKFQEVDIDLEDSYYGELKLEYYGAINCAIMCIEHFIEISGNRSESWEKYLMDTLQELKSRLK